MAKKDRYHEDHPYIPYPATEEEMIGGIQTNIYCQWMGLQNAKMHERIKSKSKKEFDNFDSRSFDASITFERDCLDWFNKKFGLEDPDPLNKRRNGNKS